MRGISWTGVPKIVRSDLSGVPIAIAGGGGGRGGHCQCTYAKQHHKPKQNNAITYIPMEPHARGQGAPEKKMLKATYIPQIADSR
jgi:hypothetical protein